MKYLLLSALAVPVAIAQPGTGSIRGTAQKSVPPALVVASRAGTPPLAENTKSVGDGSFQIQGLVKGKYSSCVQAGDNTWTHVSGTATP